MAVPTQAAGEPAQVVGQVAVGGAGDLRLGGLAHLAQRHHAPGQVGAEAAAALAETELQLQQQLQQTDLYQQALAQRKPDEALVKQHQQAEYAVAQKQQLLNYLAEQQHQASQFYSPVLQHLQQVDLPELWLTNFTLQQASSSFSGVTLQPASITLWLEGLQQLSYFKGQRFSQVSMTQIPDTTAVSFVLMAQKGETL